MATDPRRRTTAVVLGVIAVLVGWYLGAPQAVQTTTSSPAFGEVGAERSTIPVHVSGWVNFPGVVWVARESLVVDAITAAGGVRPGALLATINLAQPVEEGDQIQVPGPDESAGSLAPEGDSSGGLIDINSADSAALQQLPGVGPVLAQRIIDFRESKGPFEAIEDLLEVPGIGESRLAAMRDLIRSP